MKKQYQFRELFAGESKKTGKGFRILKLHDQQAVEPAEFFLRDTDKLNVVGIQRGDIVEVELRMDVVGGRTEVGIESIRKIG